MVKSLKPVKLDGTGVSTSGSRVKLRQTCPIIAKMENELVLQALIVPCFNTK